MIVSGNFAPFINISNEIVFKKNKLREIEINNLIIRNKNFKKREHTLII